MKIQRMRNILLSSVLSLALGSLLVGCEGTSTPIEQTTNAKEESKTSNNIVVSQQKEEVTIQKKEVITQKEEITIQEEEVITKQEEVYKKKKNIPLSTEPTNYRRFALVANGKITVKNRLTTDGPLADIHANGTIDAVTEHLWKNCIKK